MRGLSSAAVFPQGVHHRLRPSYILSKFCWWIDKAIATDEEEFLAMRPGWISTRRANTPTSLSSGPLRRSQLKAKTDG